MPSLEESPMDTCNMMPLQSATANEEAAAQIQHGQDIEPPVVRELTQTDRLNNRLLKSFLNRINTSSLVEQFRAHSPTPEDVEESRTDDFEEQFVGSQIM